MNSRRAWKQEEDQSIVQLVKTYGRKNWAQIALELAKKYGAPRRSGKQCRQRWHNHLNPDIQKKSWSKAEEELMFELHQIHGNKWTVIAESLPGRTDNAIKNYFYSTIRRSLRRMGKFVGSKNSTEQMKHIKPSTLSKIFAAGSELHLNERMPLEQQKLISYIRENCETVRNQIIKFTNYKPKRNDKAAQLQKLEFEKVIQEMIHINEIYEKIKVDEKRRRSQELMFQKDNGKLMLSDDSFDEESQENQKQSEFSQKQLKTANKDKIKVEELSSYNEVKNTETIPKPTKHGEQQPRIQPSTQQNSIIVVPTVIIKPQPNLSPLEHLEHQSLPQHNAYEPAIPEFLVELKEEDYIHVVHNPNRSNFSVQSPGYYINTPTNNPFFFFQSPNTPKPNEQDYRVLQGFRGLQNLTIAQFQISAIQLQKKIELNMTKDRPNTLGASTSTIGTPLSAFSPCSLP